jgi:hypothetical protein
MPGGAMSGGDLRMVDDLDTADQSLASERDGSGKRRPLLAFAVLAAMWLGFVAFGQVRARFWLRNEFQIEWKSVTGVWRVALGELPGGTTIQVLVLASALVVVVGVLGCLYLMLVTSHDIDEHVSDQR